MREQFAALLLFGVQVQAAHGHARLVVAVERQHERRHDQAEGEHHHDPQHDREPAEPRLGVQRLARAARPAAHRDEEDPEAEDHPEDHDGDDHGGENISAGAVGRSRESPLRFRSPEA